MKIVTFLPMQVLAASLLIATGCTATNMIMREPNVPGGFGIFYIQTDVKVTARLKKLKGESEEE